jgi:hypothetical protein
MHARPAGREEGGGGTNYLDKFDRIREIQFPANASPSRDAKKRGPLSRFLGPPRVTCEGGINLFPKFRVPVLRAPRSSFPRIL